MNTNKSQQGAARNSESSGVYGADFKASRPIRVGLAVLVLGFGGFLAWAAFAPLDEGVSAPATVSVEAHRRVIQHMTGGVVRRVLVTEGQLVRAGEILIELDDAAARANLAAVRTNYLALRAAEDRLTAEQSEARTITFHADLTDAVNDPTALQQVAAQTRLFTARRAALRAEIAGLHDSMEGLRAQVAGYARMAESRDAQAAAQAEQIANLRELADQGYAPRNQLLQLLQQQAELQANRADLQANRAKALQSIAELESRIAQRQQEYQKEAGAALQEVRREVQADREKVEASRGELARMRIQAPVAGQVIGLTIGAPGGVVSPGQRLMDIAPEAEGLLLDARIPTQVIDRVKVGDSADVRFFAFAGSPSLVAEARLVSLSSDAITEVQGTQAISYYLGRARLTESGLKALGGRVVQPGMPAELLIRTGERSLLTYLLHPLLKRIAVAMKEE